MLRTLFSLSGQVERRFYAGAGVALMLLKYALDGGLVYAATGKVFTPADYLHPLYTSRTEAFSSQPWVAPTLALLALPFLWIGVGMTLRRLLDAGLSPWWALLFFVPGLNYVLMVTLSALPSSPRPALELGPVWRSALLANALAVAISLGMLGASVYVLRTYSASLLLGTPFVMGVVAGLLLNRTQRRSAGLTLAAGASTVGLSGLAFLLFALEGVICLLMAAPPALLLGMLGALVGRALARPHLPSGPVVALLVLALPLGAYAEHGLAEVTLREVMTSVEISAPPEKVFQNVVGFSELPRPEGLLFRHGVAHPRRARIEGRGVGAVRYCEFSTGAFVEPITAWEEPYRLAFDVTSQPQPMREWSPAGDIPAPHLDGYFKSHRGEFRLVPLPGGRTRLEGRTWYTVDLRPVPYWNLWADFLVQEIHGEVLRHVQRLSEAG